MVAAPVGLVAAGLVGVGIPLGLVVFGDGVVHVHGLVLIHTDIFGLHRYLLGNSAPNTSS